MSTHFYISRLKLFGLKRALIEMKKKISGDTISNFESVKPYFASKNGLEIGGPSMAFYTKRYLPIYDSMNSLDGVNFSDSTVWTEKVNDQNFRIETKTVGKLYIAEGTDLSSLPSDIKYDFILSCNNIEHIANPMKAIEEWNNKLSVGGVMVIIAPRKESNFDHKRKTVTFEHILQDFNNHIDEHDLTHLEEILRDHDLSLDPAAGTPEQFRERGLKNFENRCLHHHVYDLSVLEKMCNHFNLKTVHKESKFKDHIIIAKK